METSLKNTASLLNKIDETILTENNDVFCLTLFYKSGIPTYECNYLTCLAFTQSVAWKRFINYREFNKLNYI